MIKECINELADNIEELTLKTLEMYNCPLEECFPAMSDKLYTISDKNYKVEIIVKVKNVINERKISSEDNFYEY